MKSTICLRCQAPSPHREWIRWRTATLGDGEERDYTAPIPTFLREERGRPRGTAVASPRQESAGSHEFEISSSFTDLGCLSDRHR